jgi:hypothetical protein
LKESLRFEIQCLSPEQMRTLVGEL